MTAYDDLIQGAIGLPSLIAAVGEMPFSIAAASVSKVGIARFYQRAPARTILLRSILPYL